MRLLVQVVDSAILEIVEKNQKKSIGKGLLVYVGISSEDEKFYQEKIEKISYKLPNLKFFDDEKGKLSLSLNNINGDLLLVPNFTLYGKNKKGTKLDFNFSAGFNTAKNIYTELVNSLQNKLNKIESGEFGGNMHISSKNIGPINIVLDY